MLSWLYNLIGATPYSKSPAATVYPPNTDPLLGLRIPPSPSERGRTFWRLATVGYSAIGPDFN